MDGREHLRAVLGVLYDGLVANRVPVERILRKADNTLTTTPRPFLRWAGSKRRHLKHLVATLPSIYNTYWEPFLGSAALLFLLEPKKAVLSDSCGPLIETFAAVRDGPHAVHRHYAKYTVTDPDLYYEVRAETPPRDRFERAARFIYLNRACWNGLYRVNSQGEFNVPFGRPRTDTPLDKPNLLACSRLLKQPGVQLRMGDFEPILGLVKKGDLVFFDPPYVTGHNNNGFVDYNKQLFSWSDQERLAQVAEDLRRKGAHVRITNAAHRDLLKLYPNFYYFEFERSSTLAANTSKRKAVREAVFFTED